MTKLKIEFSKGHQPPRYRQFRHTDRWRWYAGFRHWQSPGAHPDSPLFCGRRITETRSGRRAADG